jgi:hypothetical protein
MKNTIKKALGILLAATLLAGPTMASADDKSDNPVKEGATEAFGIVGKSLSDVGEGLQNSTEFLVDKTEETAENINKNAKKAGQNIVETNKQVFEAMTEEKVQAGVSGGLAVGLPAGGAAYLIAAAAGMSNPITAALVTTSLVSTAVGMKTAQRYENLHEN